MTIIKSLLFSKLYYCSSIWSNASDTDIRKPQGVQNLIACIVYIRGRRNFDHVAPVLKDLRWISVKSDLYPRDAILAFKCMTRQVPTYQQSSNLISRGSVSVSVTGSSQ